MRRPARLTWPAEIFIYGTLPQVKKVLNTKNIRDLLPLQPRSGQVITDGLINSPIISSKQLLRMSKFICHQDKFVCVLDE